MKLFRPVLALGFLAAACNPSGAPPDPEPAAAPAQSGPKPTPTPTPTRNFAAEYVEELASIADALEEVEDPNSAEAAAVIIRRAGRTLESLSEQHAKDATQDEAWVAMGSQMKDLIDLQHRIDMASGKIASDRPDLFETVAPALRTLP